ncbi:MAG TPA: transposase [Methylomirabilota bacterium]|nr:transposase [Methylomirabilota bacterium]
MREHLPHARIVYDKFHVLRHASEAVDETRRAEFFRKRGVARALVAASAGCCSAAGPTWTARTARRSANSSPSTGGWPRPTSSAISSPSSGRTPTRAGPAAF